MIPKSGNRFSDKIMRNENATPRTMNTATSERENTPASADISNQAPLLAVEGLQAFFDLRHGLVKAVDGVSFALAAHETLAIVGESGCGKSITALSLMRLVPDPPGRIAGGTVKLDGVDLLALSEDAMRGVRGKDIAMIFQEPMTSLNPVLTIGSQIAEVLLLHEPISRQQAWNKSIDMLRLARIPEPEQRAKEYPHQLSGGMRQRAMIAMALACNPKVLIADEPTTALDVTIQAQILDIILDLQRKLGTAVILITHDLGVVAETAQRVIVMYAGRKVEEAPVDELFARPQHPYTHGLLASIPRLPLLRGETDDTGERLQEIPGMVPALTDLPAGCVFAPRCAYAEERCRRAYPDYEEKRPRHWAACWRSAELFGERNG
jgi:peptide/nickel transport system ATP-binding protein